MNNDLGNRSCMILTMNGCIHAHDSLSRDDVDPGNGFFYALPMIAILVIIPKFDRFMDPGGGSGRNGRPCFDASLQDYVHFISGITSRI
jgi:hypothetical protein